MIIIWLILSFELIYKYIAYLLNDVNNDNDVQ